MNIRILLVSLLAAVRLTAAESPASSAGQGKVGVYDSRAVAFAHFWSQPVRLERDALVAEAKAAKAAGDTARLRELEQRLTAAQTRSHLQVFSTAPADEAMAALKDQLAALQRAAGVVRVVSKWDDAALQGVPESARVDVTDRLVEALRPDKSRLKTLEQLKAAKPLPLDEAKRKAAAGKL